MELIRLLILIYLGHGPVCLNSSNGTRSSTCKHYLATTGKLQYWTRLPQCVKACLERNDCNVTHIKSRGRGTPCSLLAQTQDAIPSQFPVNAARIWDAGGSTDWVKTDEAFTSTISQTSVIGKRDLEQTEKPLSSSSHRVGQETQLRPNLKSGLKESQEIRDEVEKLSSENKKKYQFDKTQLSESTSNFRENGERSVPSAQDIHSMLFPTSTPNKVRGHDRPNIQSTPTPTSSPRRTSNKEQAMTIRLAPATGKRTLSPRKASSNFHAQYVTPVTVKQASFLMKTDGGQPVAIPHTSVSVRSTLHPGIVSMEGPEQSIVTPSTSVRITQKMTQDAVKSSPRTHVRKSPRLAVLQQFITRKRRKGMKHVCYVLNPETSTFIKQTVTIDGQILKAVVDFDKETIYWFEYLKRSRCSILKSTSFRSSKTTRIRSICTPITDIDTKHNTLYFAQKTKKRWILFKQCIEFERHLSASLQKAKGIYTLSSRFIMSCFRVDKDRLIFCSNHHKSYTKIYLVNLKHKETEQFLKLRPKKTEIYIFPFKQHIYWTDRSGTFSATALKDKKTERLSGCGSSVRSLGSLGRYGGLWYLSCYTGEVTEIHFYDDNMKRVKKFTVPCEGVVASAG